MNIFFIIVLLIIVFCVYSDKVEKFSCGCGKPNCKCGCNKARCPCCQPEYRCNVSKHLRRKCTWISKCYN